MKNRSEALKIVKEFGLLNLIPHHNRDAERPFGVVYLTVNLSAYRQGRKPLFYIGQRKLPSRIQSIQQDSYLGSGVSLVADIERGDEFVRFTIDHATDADDLREAERLFCEAMEVGDEADFYNRNNTGGGGGEAAARQAAATRRAKLDGSLVVREKPSRALTRFAVRRIPEIIKATGGEMALERLDAEVREQFVVENGWDVSLDAPMDRGPARTVWRYALVNARAQLSGRQVLWPAKQTPGVARLMRHA